LEGEWSGQEWGSDCCSQELSSLLAFSRSNQD
jgi:hypothetical protein